MTIVNNTVNDVAATVLPDAPIDPATGLPVPTIAVATDGGISQIGWDGVGTDNVWDITSSTYPAVNKVDFLDDNRMIALFASTLLSINNIVTADDAGTGNLGSGVRYTGNVGDEPTFPLSGSTRLSGKISAVSGGNGLYLLKDNPTTKTKGMVAYITSSYNSGYQNGDIKGAFLSDTDDTDLVGSGELVTNGTFDTDTSGWSGRNANTVLAVSSARLSVSAGAADVAYAHQQITAAAGVPYVLTLDYFDITGTPRVYIGTGPGTNTYYDSGNLSGNGSLTVTFTPTSANPYISLYAEISSTSGLESQYDNISVKLADADRSVNSNGLVIEGSITRTPVATGADLVAYSGFSASNYLEQPYNSDLDFGTSDFCVMGWVIGTKSGQILDRFDAAETGARFALILGNSYTRFFTSSGFFDAPALSVGPAFVVMLRKSGVLYGYINGLLVGSVASTGSLTNTSANLRVGTRANTSSPPILGSLALWRISATAPTAEQIAKIYEDEKALFQENAQATLYGTSDAVTALAHDDATNLLHVGTSAGRSVFQGLRRVSNTTTAVGTAISASNGLVVEE